MTGKVSYPRLLATSSSMTLLAAALGIALSSPAAGQLMEPAHYLLEDVIHGPAWPTDRQIGSVEIFPKRGRVHFPVRHNSRCREIYEFNWWFDKELERLEAGERFKVNAHAVLRSADCFPNADPYFTIVGNLAAASEILRTQGVDTSKIYKGISGSSEGIYLKGSQQRRGPREVWLEMPSQIPYKVPYVWFGVMIRAPSPNAPQLVNYDVIYLYRAQFSFR